MGSVPRQSCGGEMMPEFLNDPFLQSSLLPLLLSAMLAGGLRLLRQPWASVAPLLAFLLIFVWVIGMPAFPPPASMGKLFWLLVAGAILALGLDAAEDAKRIGSGALALGVLAGLAWMTAAQLNTLLALSLMPLAGLAVWIALGGFSAWLGGNDQPLPSGAVALAWAAAVGGVALVGSSAALAQAGLSLAAAIGGLLVWNWPKARDHAGVAGRVLLLAPLLLATVLIFFTQADAVVLPVLLISPLAARLVLKHLAGRFGPAVTGAALTIATMLPAAIAVGLAALLAANQTPYGS